MNLLELTSKLNDRRVLVLGDIMLDEYVWGVASRLSPEIAIPIVEARDRTFSPGGAANVAVNIQSLGGTTFLAGVIGQDNAGTILCRELQKWGVGADGIVVDDKRPTINKERIIAGQRQIVRVDTESRLPISREMEDTLLAWAERVMPHVDVCVLSDYAKGVVSSYVATRFIKHALASDKPVIVDPKGMVFAKYKGATIVSPNSLEAITAAGMAETLNPTVPEVGRRLLEILPDSHLLITQGASGMSLFQRGADQIRPLHIKSIARQVNDVTGAGDTVIGVLALALAANATVEQAARLSNCAAGIVVGKVGTASTTLDELRSEVTLASH